MLAPAPSSATATIPVTETITIVADEWCPYNCNEDAEKPGYMVEIVRRVLKKHDIDVVYKVMPWTEALEMTRQGKYNAIIAANRGDAKDFIFPEIVQGISIIQTWVRNDSKWVYQGVTSLDKLRLGIVSGYYYGKEIDPYLRKRESGSTPLIQAVNKSNAAELNISELLAGNIDVILEDRNVVDYYFASREMPAGIKAAGNPVSIDNYDDTYLFVAFSPSHPRSKDYAKMITQGMQEMRQSGELKEILSSYNIDSLYRYLGKPAKAQ